MMQETKISLKNIRSLWLALIPDNVSDKINELSKLERMKLYNKIDTDILKQYFDECDLYRKELHESGVMFIKKAPDDYCIPDKYRRTSTDILNGIIEHYFKTIELN